MGRKPKVEPASPQYPFSSSSIGSPLHDTTNKIDKKGRSTSCYLCQKRKQKCDHRIPSCTTCIRAGVECVKPVKYGVKAPTKDEYTIMLEKKIKFLEKSLDKQLSNEKTAKSLARNQALNNYKKVSPFIQDQEQQEQQQEHQQRQLLLLQQQQQQQRHIQLQQQPFQIPNPQASISAANQLKIPHNTRILPTISNFDRDSLKNLDFNLSNDYNESFISKYNLKEFLNNEPVYDIDENYSRQLLDIYFSRLQYKFPLLNEREYMKLHESYFNNDIKEMINTGEFFHISFAKIWLIFSIAASLHMTTGRYTGPSPKRFFCTALRHIAKRGRCDSLDKIEILTMMVVYLTRTDKDSIGVFDIIGDAIKICIELKLHKAETYLNETDPKLRDRKMRVFWSCYIFEKTTAIAVSKSYILPESMVDKDLPLFEYEPSNALHPAEGPMFINQTIKIRRIEARFVETLQIIGTRSEVTKDQLPQVGEFFEELDEWRRSCEGFTKGVENETLSTYYYRSVRVLIQPFLELLDPEDKLFKECQAAAGQICQLFKAFHQKTVFGHSTTHIHTVFVAGVTLIYCLWLTRNKDDMRRKQLGDISKHTRPIVSEALFSGLDDLRACSVCLFVMSERTKFALSFRDTFDELMNATIGNLILRCGPDSSEIIYNNGPGMPPAIVRKPMHHFSIDESNTKFTMKKTDEEKLEELERKKKQGQLQKSIPKSLSHLLIHSPPLRPEESRPSSIMEEGRISSASSRIGTPQQQVVVPQLASSYMYQQAAQSPMPQQATPLSAQISQAQQLQQQQQQAQYAQPQPQPQPEQQQQQQQQPQQHFVSHNPPVQAEITPFNGRTTAMINNISTWTGESGQQINTGLLNFNLNDLDDLLFNGVNVVSEEYVFTP